MGCEGMGSSRGLSPLNAIDWGGIGDGDCPCPSWTVDDGGVMGKGGDVLCCVPLGQQMMIVWGKGGSSLFFLKLVHEFFIYYAT
jgi:hypothetical protein